MINNSYNSDIANKLLNKMQFNKNIHIEPEQFNNKLSGGSYNRCIGGSDLRQSTNTYGSYYKDVSGNSEYIQPGVCASYPQFNMVELRELDSKPVINVPTMQGGKNSMTGGFSFNDFINSVKSVAKPLVSTALDVGAPMLGALGGPTGQIVANAARDIIKTKTGYGRKTKKVAGVGILSTIKDSKKTNKKIKSPLDNNSNKENIVPNLEALSIVKGGKRGRKLKSKSTINTDIAPITPKSSLKKRFEIVKQIMKEKNLSLPAASKYVKDNKLY